MRQKDSKDVFWRWGHYMFRFRWLVLILWILAFSFLSLFAQKLPDRLKENGFNPVGSESDLGITRMQEDLNYSPSTIQVVYTSEELDLTSPTEMTTILDSLDNIDELPFVKDVKINPLERVDQDKGLQSVIIELDLKGSTALDMFPDIRKMIKPPEGMNVYVDGGTATLFDVQQATKRDMAKAEAIGIPIALSVLLIIFGTLVAAMLPLIVGVVSVTVTLGITYFVAGGYSLSNFLPNIVMMLGLAIGSDYALFVVSRFREELKVHRTVSEAVAMTAQKAGKSVFFSGLAVLIGMFGMLFIKLPIMYALCIGGVVVVITTVVLSNTLLLSLLSIFGRNINRFRIFTTVQKRMGESTLWEQIAFGVMKRPLLLALLMIGFLIALMIPIGGMKLGVPNAEVLPPSYESRIGADLLKGMYNEREANPIQIVINTKADISEQSTVEKIYDYSEQIRKLDGTKRVESFITALGKKTPEETSFLLSRNDTLAQLEALKLLKGNTALISVVPAYKPDSIKTSDLIHKIRTIDVKGLNPLVTGGPAYRFDMMDRINSGLPSLILFVMAVTYIILLVAFKSILIPLKAVLMNILSLGASLGIVVVIFQKGWLADVLQVTSTGYVSIIMPVTIFCVVFGISMDYEVFLISRIMEEYERTGDNERSTAEGLQKTGSLITSAASILIVVVGSFIFTDIEITKALGIGLFCAIFIDATLIRIIVVPALMKLLGDANWWAPKWIGGRH